MNRGSLVINVTCCGLNDQGSIFEGAGILRHSVQLSYRVHPVSCKIGTRAVRRSELEVGHSNLSTFQNEWSYFHFPIRLYDTGLKVRDYMDRELCNVVSSIPDSYSDATRILSWPG